MDSIFIFFKFGQDLQDIQNFFYFHHFPEESNEI